MKRLLLSFVALLALVGSAGAVDLTATFGAGQSIVNVAPQYCQVQATHGSSQVLTGSVGLTANGSDSAVISVTCNGVSVTTTMPSITVNSTVVNNIAFPQTVTSTAAGVWIIKVGSLSPLTIFAQ